MALKKVFIRNTNLELESTGNSNANSNVLIMAVASVIVYGRQDPRFETIAIDLTRVDRLNGLPQ